MTTIPMQSSSPLLDDALYKQVHRIGKEVLQATAADVDRQARFPHESIQALRDAQLFSAFVPEVYGGAGLSLPTLATIAQILAQYCANTAMIWSMHQIQVACIVQHAQTQPFFQEYLHAIVQQQLLLASITSEVGVGGDMRSSIAAVEKQEADCTLRKQSTTLSYGAYADGFLATARRTPESAAGDQVLVLLTKADSKLTPKGTWNPLGMRGTCSPAFSVESRFPQPHIFKTSFADIATQTMVPFSHLLWSSCWEGIATEALGRARKFLQGKARQLRTTSVPGDTRLVEANGRLHLMRAQINEVLNAYHAMLKDAQTLEDATSDLGFAIKLNNIKIFSSQLVVEIVQEALLICGMAGYAEDSPFSVARHLRDAYSAALMINNDRLQSTNAALLLVHKEA